MTKYRDTDEIAVLNNFLKIHRKEVPTISRVEDIEKYTTFFTGGLNLWIQKISFWSRTINISNNSIEVDGRGLGWYDLGMDPIDPNWFGIDPKILSFFPNWIPMKRCSTILPLCWDLKQLVEDKTIMMCWNQRVSESTQSTNGQDWSSLGGWSNFVFVFLYLVALTASCNEGPILQ